MHDRTNIYKGSTFDYVLDQDSSQKRVYDKVGIADLVKQVVDGYHATVFAYGQTGSGKTFTMEGYKYKQNDKGVPVPIIEQGENEGLVPRAIHHLFDSIKQQANLQQKKFTVYCSYLQIYKEKIFDLLNKAQLKRLVNDGPGLKLKWNKNDHFTVENLYTFECRSPDDVLALYHFGIRNKVVASHNMNNSSSRSHTMLSLTVEQIDSKNPDNVVMSKLQLVDLAGSERQAFTGNAVNKESIDINKSLFTLRQVITALTEKKNGTNNYVPYRESKLTSILRQSLGGNSFCLMIACLNPCDQYIEENINTLQYAGKASNISNKPMRNDDPKMRLIEELKKENKLLNEELSKANDTIQFLSQITGSNPQAIKNNLGNVQMPGLQIQTPPTEMRQSLQDRSRQGSASSAITEKRRDSSERRTIITERIIKDKDNIEKFFKDKSETLQNIANINKPMTNLPSAANESKDAITERIIHTVNMMKEVLQSNLNLRETIQKQSEIIDGLNADIFQLQNENEDLRDRVQILEEYTGKDSYVDVSKLVKEKKVLENRVKHLEQTSMNWQQFQATRQNFHQAKELVNKSQAGLLPKATLNNEFNDDYEPVRCAINVSGTNSEHTLQDTQVQQIQQNQSTTKKKKIEQINYQKQVKRGGPGGKSTAMGMQSQMSEINTQTNASASDRHQEYKIRTVKSLANAYQQQQQLSQQYFKSRVNVQTTKNTSQNLNNNSATKFNQVSGMNFTAYDRQRNSIGISGMSQSTFNGNNTQDISNQSSHNNYNLNNQLLHQNTQDDPRTKSPQIGTVASNHKFLNQKQMSMPPRQNNDERYYHQQQHQGNLRGTESLPNEPSQYRDQSSLPSSNNNSLRVKRDLEQAKSFSKPPKSPDKYSVSQKKTKRNGTGQDTSNSQRDRMNVSADYINNSHHNSNNKNNIIGNGAETFEDDSSSSNYKNNHNYDEDQQEYYDEEEAQEEQQNNEDEYNDDTYAPVRTQQKPFQPNSLKAFQNSGGATQNINRAESGLGQLDVSLPMIKNSSNQQ